MAAQPANTYAGKRWWVVKRKTHIYWLALRITTSDLGLLEDGYEFRGPFPSRDVALWAVDQEEDK